MDLMFFRATPSLFIIFTSMIRRNSTKLVAAQNQLKAGRMDGCAGGFIGGHDESSSSRDAC